ncbi:MAG: type II toxin-antitoxin system HicA family toxin [Myxococcota bacterium]|nr:type II toxin-antitoxin system HicA family toxin [Myxococcota bacterium]
MHDLPVVSGQQARRVFERCGWVFRRQTGSHMVLTREGSIVSLSVPDHRELAPGTLRKLIRLAGMDVEEFCRALE